MQYIFICCRFILKVLKMSLLSKPHVLIDFFKDELYGVPQMFIDEIEKEYQICWMKEFDSNPSYYANKIVAVLSILGSKVPQILLSNCTNLKIVAIVSAGYNHIDVPLIRSYGVRISNTPVVSNETVADMGMALMLCAGRNLPQNLRIGMSPETKSFPKNNLSPGVCGSTLGIVGMGGIGLNVAERAKGFKMKILYHNRNRRPDDHMVNAEFHSSLDLMLPLCDYVIVTVQLTPETRKMFGKKQFKLMKKSAIFVNISRGGTVDHEALTAALTSGEIHSAALDVTDPEPLPRDHALLKLNNVFVTPHCSSATESSRMAMIKKALENVRAALQGKPLPSEVLQ